jgi:hypothetical protein
MQLKDVMTREVEVISPDASLDGAARQNGPAQCRSFARHAAVRHGHRPRHHSARDGSGQKIHALVREAMVQDVLYCLED